MKRQSLAFIVFVGIILVFFGCWIVSQNSNSNILTDVANQQQTTQQLNNGTNSVFEPLPSNQSISWLNATSNSAETSGVSGALLNSDTNVTDNIAENLSQDFIAAGGKISTSSADDLISKYSSITQLTSTTSLEFDKPINNNKLHISQDNSKEAKRQYFQNIYLTISANIDYLANDSLTNAARAAVENNDLSLAQEIVDKSSQLVDKIAALSVPSDLVSLHEKTINTFDNIGYFYSIITNYQQDPIKVALAIDYFPNIISEDQSTFTDLQKASDAVN